MWPSLGGVRYVTLPAATQHTGHPCPERCRPQRDIPARAMPGSTALHAAAADDDRLLGPMLAVVVALVAVGVVSVGSW